jgi:hypothetical protein
MSLLWTWSHGSLPSVQSISQQKKFRVGQDLQCNTYRIPKLTYFGEIRLLAMRKTELKQNGCFLRISRHFNRQKQEETTTQI